MSATAGVIDINGTWAAGPNEGRKTQVFLLVAWVLKADYAQLLIIDKVFI